MLYTRKGDDGTTKKFDCDQRFSKSSAVAEALGTLDEVNSFLGVVKVESTESGFTLEDGRKFDELVHIVQKDIFIIQAEVAGAEKNINEDKVKWLEEIIDGVEKELPPINSFFISGGTKLGAFFDFARTVARRAERGVIAVCDEGTIEIGQNTKAYLNRLSSFLYAMARLSVHKSGITEQSPDYL